MLNRLILVIAIAVVAASGVYTYVVDKAPVPTAAKVKAKVEGSVYMLEKEFLVNLADGRFARLQVGLVLASDDTSTVPANGGNTFAPTRPSGYGAMLQEGVVRDVITTTLTGAVDTDLMTTKGRRRIKAAVLKEIKDRTDVKAERVVLADVVVQ
ncbi:flagellar basal body-associated FliL family protein [Solirubrobacter phytolaccae]|uniref:Flagellar protein FliL n=1 Tax=Solirubrobacter phytolaccae TaxID=1404360 RepID=A0A9X3NA91_9ACTN|nr:flagellar basal body-associated FliL family protein [Solirubrobacter phytolaccae]MDA0180371.1 flagellar basal body-associated FliL family protein [Solirubrobacter phytolaccae]